MNRFGQYEITNTVGKGGMGVVYRARDPMIGRDVAIKVIRLEQAGDPEDRKLLQDRLYREARSAGILSHPGIVTIYQVGVEDESAFIAMEFVNGPSLEAVLKSGSADMELIVRTVRQTAAALDHAHRKGIVHRDIKPANLMIHDDGSIKVCDFGIAKIHTGQSTMTQAGYVMGTPFYMSPEQIQGKPVDGRSDQYALGVVVYEMLAGTKPFSAETLATLVLKVLTEEPPPLKELNPALSDDVCRVVLKALSKDREQRYSNCSDFAEAFAAAVEGRPVVESATVDTAPIPAATVPVVAAPPPADSAPVEAAPAPPAPARKPRKPLLALAAAGLFLAVLAAAGGWIWLRGSPPAVGSDPLPGATVGTVYAHALSASGGRSPLRWSVVSGAPPSGLTLEAASGIVRGTPGATGEFRFRVRVTDTADRFAEGDCAITVAEPAIAAPPLIETAFLNSGTEGAPYSAALAVSRGTAPYKWSVESGALPDGVQLKPDSGRLEGTPAKAGSYRAVLAVTDSARLRADRRFEIRIASASAPPADAAAQAAAPGPPSNFHIVLPRGTIGTAYSFALKVPVGQPPFRWVRKSGSLPAGLAVAEDGTISGIPSAAGNFAFEMQVSDRLRRSLARTFTIDVKPPAPPSGRIQWSGRLEKGTLTIEYNKASEGVLNGEFPGVPIKLTKVNPRGISVVEPPSERNGWSGLKLTTGNRKVTSITLDWVLAK